MRGQLAEAYGARGHGRSNLWLVYSPKADRDFVLRSDLEFGHFLWVESDPAIKRVDYAPAKRVASIAGDAFGTVVDAEIELQVGVHIWREVKSSTDLESDATTRANLQLLIELQAATELAARHEVVTEKDIYACPQRIHNWLRIVPWLAQAREWTLIDFQNDVAALINARRHVTLDEVRVLGPPDRAALYLAALFRSVQQGRFASDLNELPLSPQSLFYRAPEAS